MIALNVYATTSLGASISGLEIIAEPKTGVDPGVIDVDPVVILLYSATAEATWSTSNFSADTNMAEAFFQVTGPGTNYSDYVVAVASYDTPSDSDFTSGGAFLSGPIGTEFTVSFSASSTVLGPGDADGFADPEIFIDPTYPYIDLIELRISPNVTLVPEPTTALLLACGLAGLALRRKRGLHQP